ncbi:MAG TPA: asparaginase [Streptosporangiaceae bacterium]|nr:asparaginase [Streptosporangiaceae bacterium]
MKPADAGGVVPTLPAADLIAAIPGLGAEPPELAVHDVANKPGASLSFTELYDLADEITAALADRCTGAVVVQGTDTIEETAYLLDLLIASDSPVVATGAMRNPSLAGADGPANLLAAIRVAASETARGLGTLVVLNDQVHAARWVTKTHTANTSAFASPGFGPLGHVIEGRVDIPVRLRHRSPTLRPDRQREVRAGLMTVTLGDDGALINTVSELVDGLVVAALGVGHVPADMVPVLAKAAANIPVVLTAAVSSWSSACSLLSRLAHAQIRAKVRSSSSYAAGI